MVRKHSPSHRHTVVLLPGGPNCPTRNLSYFFQPNTWAEETVLHGPRIRHSASPVLPYTLCYRTEPPSPRQSDKHLEMNRHNTLPSRQEKKDNMASVKQTLCLFFSWRKPRSASGWLTISFSSEIIRFLCYQEAERNVVGMSIQQIYPTIWPEECLSACTYTRRANFGS